jgi:hypothetical protein
MPEQHAGDPDWKGYVETEWSYTANGALDFEDDSQVALQFHRERGWSVRFPTGWLPTEARSLLFRHAPTKEEQDPEKDLIIDEDFSLRESHEVTATGMGSTGTHPYPKTVSVLLGQSDEHRGSFPLTYGLMGVAPDVIWDYTVYLEPTSMDELRLVIEEPGDYATWRPKTTPDATAVPGRARSRSSASFRRISLVRSCAGKGTAPSSTRSGRRASGACAPSSATSG